MVPLPPQTSPASPRDRPQSAVIARAAVYFAAWLALCIAAALTGDYGFATKRSYYEADAQAIVGGAMRLPDSKRGDLPLYKYDFQPLSYEILHAAYRATDNAKLVWYLPSVFGCAGIVLLFAALRRAHGARVPGICHAAILAQVPELFFTVLYTNTTAIGLPFFALALALLYDGGKRISGAASAALAGAALAVASLCRFEFAAAGPLIFVLMLARPGGWRRCVWFVGASAAMLAAEYALGLFRPDLIFAHGEGQSVIMVASGWTREMSISVIASLFSPPFWVLLLSACGILLARALEPPKWKIPLALVATIPFLAMIQYLTTPKYLIPALCFAPFLLSAALFSLCAARPRFGRAFEGAILAACLFSHALTLDPERRTVTARPRPIPTHDGTRAYGSYLLAYATVAIRPLPGINATIGVLESRQMIDALLGGSGDCVLVYRSGTWFWKYFAYYFAPNFLAEEGFRFKFAPAPFPMLEMTRADRRVRILLGGEAALQQALPALGPTGAEAILLPKDHHNQGELNMLWDRLDRLAGGERAARFRFGKEECTLDAEGELRVSGWALSPYRIDSVTVELLQGARNDLLGDAEFPLRRPDAARAYPKFASDAAGFAFRKNVGKPGRRPRRVRIHFGQGGSTFRIVTLGVRDAADPPH